MARLAHIDVLVSRLFRLRWVPLNSEALARSDFVYPGVYLLAFTSGKIAGSMVKPD